MSNTLNSTVAPATAAVITPSDNRKQSKRTGFPNYTLQEIFALIWAVEKCLPCIPKEWEMTSKIFHQRMKRLAEKELCDPQTWTRSVRSLKWKFSTLINYKLPEHEDTIPVSVERAREANKKLEKKKGIEPVSDFVQLPPILNNYHHSHQNSNEEEEEEVEEGEEEDDDDADDDDDGEDDEESDHYEEDSEDEEFWDDEFYDDEDSEEEEERNNLFEQAFRSIMESMTTYNRLEAERLRLQTERMRVQNECMRVQNESFIAIFQKICPPATTTTTATAAISTAHTVTGISTNKRQRMPETPHIRSNLNDDFEDEMDLDMDECSSSLPKAKQGKRTK